MLKSILASLIVLSVCIYVHAQAKAEGGYIMKSSSGSYSTYSQEQALNSMSDWYTVKLATHDTLTVARLGSTYRLKQIYNNSGSIQKVKVVFVNALDTITINLNSYSGSGKLPSVKKVISGAVADSTLYFFQLN